MKYKVSLLVSVMLVWGTVATPCSAGIFDRIVEVATKPLLKEVGKAIQPKRRVSLEPVEIALNNSKGIEIPKMEKISSLGYVSASSSTKYRSVQKKSGLKGITIDSREGFRVKPTNGKDAYDNGMGSTHASNIVEAFRYAKHNGWGCMHPLPPEMLEEAEWKVKHRFTKRNKGE